MELTPNTAKRLLTPLNDWARRHPRRLTAGVVALLGSFAVTAFGIAPLAPDAAELPRRLVTEELQVPGLDRQIEALAEHTLELSRSDLTRPGDSAASLFSRLGVSDPEAAAHLRSDRDARRLFEGRARKMVTVRTASDGTLTELVARFAALDSAQAASHFARLTIRRADGRLHSTLETAPLLPQVRLGSGTIRSSLWAATDEARLPDTIATQLVEIFSGDLDFHRQLRKGDTFSVVYQTLTADDQPIAWDDATGRVVAAEFVNNGKALQALWYQDSRGGKGAYYGFDGESRRRAFLASPLAFSRITSGFAMRFHPILQNWRAHNGVDYAAPTGTPVRAVGDGVVESAGRMNGYGNVVQLRHAGDRTTVYAHLSRIDVRPGQRIEQGQHIGAVGATGWATGPHLHFEFRVRGQFQDPLKVVRSAEAVRIDDTERRFFQQTAAVARQRLEAAETLLGQRSDIE